MLKDLEPSLGIAARNKQIALSADSSDEMECEVPSQSPARPPPNTGLHWQPVEPEPFPSFPGMDHVPSIPPPPPPSAWPSHGSEQIDADSLYSMLMSWYMAGYHTGKVDSNNDLNFVNNISYFLFFRLLPRCSTEE